MPSHSDVRVAIDIGGTFTDIVAARGGRFVAQEKLLSTPHDYSLAIRDGLGRLCSRAGIAAAEIGLVVHGTTIATNAILAGQGARTALLTTEGFRDVLELRRMRVPELYNFHFQKPETLVPRRWRFEARERLGAGGRVITPLDRDALWATLGLIAAEAPEALAICFLHSYANPEHERIAYEEACRILGECVYVIASHQLLPEIREYERTSTTVVNAFVAPVVRAYLERLVSVLADLGIAAPLRIMQSNGGVLGVDAVLRFPATIVESGPAAGVVGGAALTRALGKANAITIDMGGTTAKASLVENGQVVKTSEYEVGAGINVSSQLVKGRGHALRLPVIDISEIGAGGGSLARLDGSGRLLVGPQSAGSDPGPVCYGRGGRTVTLTDAMVTLGYVGSGLAGGAVRIEAKSARNATQDQIATPMNLDVLEAAYGVYLVAAAVMTRAVKAVTTFRGRDPRSFALIAFGGNGPLMAPQIAADLDIDEIVVPPLPGLFSACGLLVAPTEREVARSLFARLGRISAEEVGTEMAEMAESARRQLIADGCRAERIRLRYSADLRYAGQAYELTVGLPGGATTAIAIDGLAELFHDEHERTYGHAARDEPVDLVSLRVAAQEPPALAEIPIVELPPNGAERRRQVYFGRTFGLREARVTGRIGLRAGETPGPLVIEEYDATTLVPPGWRARLDPQMNIVLRRGEIARAAP